MEIIQLSDQYERFCREWIIDHDATRAAIAAGYAPAHASNQGYRLLQMFDVQLRIEQLKIPVTEELIATREKVIHALGCIAFTDRRALKNKPINDLTDDEAMCIEGFKPGEWGTEIKVAKRMPAIKELGQHFNIYEDHQKSGAGEVHIHISDKASKL